jgi:small-conductance mechanosensitive channel
VHAFLFVERRPHEGRLAQDLLAGVIYLAALFAIVDYVFDISIQGMLATSGVIAIILGLALQSTLGDVFSGIVLSFSRPYRPGDWINVDGGEGRVIEMNWRATSILTRRQWRPLGGLRRGRQQATLSMAVRRSPKGLVLGNLQSDKADSRGAKFSIYATDLP